MDPAGLAFAGLARQAELIRHGEVSARELVQTLLERIERLDPELNAFRVVLAEQALAEAERIDARRGGDEGPPLLGVPVAVKDNMDVAGEVTTYGSEAYGEHAAADAEIVRRLRAAGAIPIGKTHLSELAIFPITQSAAWGRTRNPWALGLSPGGSSGGTAAAVAAGLVAAGTASDGGGSIRIPAACCGLFGLKPERGRVPLAPDREHWYGLTVYGCLTRGVLDSALLYDAVAERAAGESFVAAARSAPPRLRIAFSLRPSAPARMQRSRTRAVLETAELLRSLGHDVKQADPAYRFPAPAYLPRWLRGIRDDVARLAHPERLEERTRRMGRAGERTPERMLRRALGAERGYTRRAAAVLEDHDVLLTPMLPAPPETHERWERRGALAATMRAADFTTFATPWNVTGQPAASVPAGFDANGVPLAVQLVGTPNGETTLVSLAAQIEAERPWAGQRPALGGWA